MLNLSDLLSKFRIVAMLVHFDIDKIICTICIRIFIMYPCAKFHKPRRKPFSLLDHENAVRPLETSVHITSRHGIKLTKAFNSV